jgi:hypothetical protein
MSGGETLMTLSLSEIPEHARKILERALAEPFEPQQCQLPPADQYLHMDRYSVCCTLDWEPKIGLCYLHFSYHGDITRKELAAWLAAIFGDKQKELFVLGKRHYFLHRRRVEI